MAAQWFEPAGPGLPLRLRIAEAGEEAVAQVTAALDDRRLQQPEASSGTLELDGGTSLLGASTLAAIQTRLQAEGLTLVQVVSTNPHTRVAAAALGLRWIAPTLAGAHQAPDAQPTENPASLTLHRGTVRSGDQLEAAGSLLVLGDVNPGARLRAGGHVCGALPMPAAAARRTPGSWRCSCGRCSCASPRRWHGVRRTCRRPGSARKRC